MLSATTWVVRSVPRAERVLRGLCVVPVALGALWLADLRYNATPSVPVGLYRARAIELGDVTRGAMVCLRAASPAAPEALRATRWALDGEVLLKRVVGLPGDRITEASEGIAINGVLVPRSSRLSRDSHGSALPRPPFPLELGARELWLASDAAEGFDSRYFGPVDLEALGCIAEPLWTF